MRRQRLYNIQQTLSAQVAAADAPSRRTRRSLRSQSGQAMLAAALPPVHPVVFGPPMPPGSGRIAAVFTKNFFQIIRQYDMSDDFEQIIRHFEKIIRHFSLGINEKFFRSSDNMSDGFEQIIRHFAKSSAKSDGLMAFREHCSSRTNLIHCRPLEDLNEMLRNFQVNRQWNIASSFIQP